MFLLQKSKAFSGTADAGISAVAEGAMLILPEQPSHTQDPASIKAHCSDLVRPEFILSSSLFFERIKKDV